MSEHDRTDLGDEEEGRLANIRQKILESLREGPKTNAFLNATIAMDHCRRIGELRKRYRHSIRSDRLKGGLFQFTLLDKPDPEWEVDIKLITPDGQTLFYTVIVNADTAGKAKNSAGRKGVITKILAVRQKDPNAPAPVVTRPQTNRATADLRAENEALRQALGKVYKRWTNARENGQGGRKKAPY